LTITGKDTVGCLPLATLQNLFIDAQQKVLLQKENGLLKSDIGNYEAVVSEQKRALSAARERFLADSMANKVEKEKSTLLLADNQKKTKKIKRLQRAVKWTAVGGLVLTATVAAKLL